MRPEARTIRAIAGHYVVKVSEAGLGCVYLDPWVPDQAVHAGAVVYVLSIREDAPAERSALLRLPLGLLLNRERWFPLRPAPKEALSWE